MARKRKPPSSGRFIVRKGTPPPPSTERGRTGRRRSEFRLALDSLTPGQHLIVSIPPHGEQAERTKIVNRLRSIVRNWILTDVHDSSKVRCYVGDENTFVVHLTR